MRIENTIEIAAPVARVWELTLDIETWPEHSPTMTSIERLANGPLDIGSQARIKQPGQRPRVWTITALDENQRFAWSARAMGTTMTAAHVLSPSGAGTTNTLTVDIEGPLAPLIGGLIKHPILKAITTENEGFKSAAEAAPDG